MKINENKLSLYERNPHKYIDEIKAMAKKVMSEWKEECKNGEVWYKRKNLTNEEIIRLCYEDARQTRLMTRICRLETKVFKIEHSILSTPYKLCGRFFTSFQDYEISCLLNQKFIMKGEA